MEKGTDWCGYPCQLMFLLRFSLLFGFFRDIAIRELSLLCEIRTRRSAAQGPSRYSLTFLCLVPGFCSTVAVLKEAIMVEQTAQVVALGTLYPRWGYFPPLSEAVPLAKPRRLFSAVGLLWCLFFCPAGVTISAPRDIFFSPLF